MPRVTTAQDNFTGGELSPLIDGRFSLAVYFNGLHRALNWMSITQGAIRARPGFRYLGATKNNGEAVLVPFRYSVNDRYLMEFGEGYIRFYRNQALVLDTNSLAYEITTPYTAADLDKLRWVQVGNTMYFVHPNYQPRVLTRGSTHTSWTLALFAPAGNPFTSANNYPSVVAIFEQRLVMGGTNAAPAQLWFSKSADFNTFTLGTQVNDPFTNVIFQEELNAIVYLAATVDRLIVGTLGGEILISSTNNAGVSPTNFQATPQTYYGSADVPPIKLDNIVMFMMRDSVTVQSMEYDLLKEGFIADDRTITADHITLSGVSQMVFQRGKPNVVWARRKDGLLIGLTYEPRQQVFGWHRHRPAGRDSYVRSLATLPSAVGPDELYAVIRRTINNSTRRYIEVLAEDASAPLLIDYWQGGDGDEARAADRSIWLNAMYEYQRRLTHLDSAIRYDGVMAASAVLSGLSGAVTLVTTGNPFSALMVGRQIWGAAQGRATITAYTDPNTVTVQLSEDSPFTSTALLGGSWYLTAQAVAGLSHLEGETVSVVADGGRVDDRVVVGGMISLDSPAAVITVGLRYFCMGATMALEGGGANGPSQTKPKNVDRINIRVKDTIGLEYGTDLYDLQQHEWRSAEDLTGRPPPLFTGDIVDLKIPDDWTETEKRIYIAQREPQPATVLMIMPHFAANDT